MKWIRSTSALLLGLAACATPTPQAANTPTPLHTPEPGDKPLAVQRMAGHHSPWQWTIQTPDGAGRLECRYLGTDAGADAFSAVYTAPGGRAEELPRLAVSAACAMISEDPEMTAWLNDRGYMALRLSGTISGGVSEGIFYFKDGELIDWEAKATPAIGGGIRLERGSTRAAPTPGPDE